MLSDVNKQTMRSATPAVASPIHPGASPMRHLVDLFIRPRKFFSSQLALGKTSYVLFVTLCLGMAEAINRIDMEMMRTELGQSRAGWEAFGPLVAQSWIGFWLWVLFVGAIGAALIWWIGGWWYRVRLKWCDAQNPDKRQARLVYVYASFVAAGPSVALALAWTLVYPNYAQAYSAGDLFSALIVIFPFWSLIASYAGARTVFDASRWKARVWFVLLPALFYLVVMGVLAALLALVEG
ncbi:MAG: hypothetical protein D6814_00370 [Calditrichaeota bacterium]|nr:MAG: hypothetical protein D6814_00370 [Calditrichota bacterium]